MKKKQPFIVQSRSGRYITLELKVPPKKYRELVQLASEGKTSVAEFAMWCIESCTT